MTEWWLQVCNDAIPVDQEFDHIVWCALECLGEYLEKRGDHF